MPRVTRNANVVWEGNVARGGGRINGQSGALADLAVTLASRVGSPEGKTSPEELIAAAHAACYAMSLSTELSQAGTPPERLDVSSTVVLDEVGGSHAITGADVQVSARVPGTSDESFQHAVRAADDGCTISNLLRGTGEVRVDARLET